jgi:hypothetical protein
VKRRRNLLGRADANLRRQLRVEQALDDSRRDVVADEHEAGDLSEGVDAGIRPAGAGHGHLAIVEIAQRVFDQSLNGCAAGLPLPAEERSTVIRDRDSVARHCRTAEWQNGRIRPTAASLACHGQALAHSGHLSGSYVGSE